MRGTPVLSRVAAFVRAVVMAAGFGGVLIRADAQPLDLLLVDGNIHTLDSKRPRAEAVGVRAGRIEFIGTSREAELLRGEARRVVELAGKTVVPGLNDAHMHLAGVGLRELSFNLEGTRSLAELQARLRERVVASGPRKWITGRGWIETHWSPSRFPTAKDLDEVAADHPVALERADGHALVANSLALRIAGITKDTPNPSGGEILRDPKTGEATGILVDNAMQFVERLVPPPTDAEIERALIVGAEREASLGWTGIQIAGHSFSESEVVRRLVREGKIRIRVYDAVSGPGDDVTRLAQNGLVVGETDGRYTRRGVKLYIDGALGSRGAALLEPYSDYASSGLLMQDRAKLKAFLIDALKQGIQVQTHAIGDRGNRVMLDLYEEVFAQVPAKERKVADPRWRIEHAQVLHPADIPRFAKLGVIASMQPSHAIGDLFFAPSRLGTERLRGAYAWQSLLKSGARIAAGSDAPVERGEPMIEFYAAVARRSLDGFANDDWHREERMTREQALRAMTWDAAFAVFEESDCGSIELGKRGDFTVLSADIMKIPEPEILKTRCEMTIVGGQIVYGGQTQP
jgi:predicted amidohydrolase YtcJ